jgi:hypothetical protein
MKAVVRDPVRFDVFQAFVDSQKGAPNLIDPNEIGKFITSVHDSIDASLKNPAFMHGQRTQAMFRDLVVALGQTTMIKEEDAGKGYVDAPALVIPDFQIRHRNGSRFLVEVKNNHSKKPQDPKTLQFSMKSSYYEGLKQYAEWLGCPIKLAVYWTGWRLWTLTPLEMLSRRGNKCVLSLGDATQYNEMVILGDFLIETTFPLTLELIADSNKPINRIIRANAVPPSPDEEWEFYIREVAFFCNGQKILDRREKDLAWSMILFGNWHSGSSISHDENNVIRALVFESRPRDSEKGKSGYAYIGFISEIFSQCVAFTTTNERRVIGLASEQASVYLKNLLTQISNRLSSHCGGLESIPATFHYL